MTSNIPTIIIDNNKIISQISYELNQLKNFTDREFINNENRNYLIKKLNLDSPFWVDIRKKIFSQLNEKYFVVVRNLPFDDNNRFLVALMSFIGQPVVQFNHKIETIVRIVTPRNGVQYNEAYPHTDSVYWPEPNDIVGLHCDTEDQNKGGKSRIVSFDAVIDELKESPKLITQLNEKKYPFSLDPRFGDSGYHLQHILTQKNIGGKSSYEGRFLLYDTMTTNEKFKIGILKSELENLATFEKIATKLGKTEEFLVKKGELLLFDNKKALHSRSPTSQNSIRFLKHIKFNIDRERFFN